MFNNLCYSYMLINNEYVNDEQTMYNIYTYISMFIYLYNTLMMK